LISREKTGDTAALWKTKKKGSRFWNRKFRKKLRNPLSAEPALEVNVVIATIDGKPPADLRERMPAKPKEANDAAVGVVVDAAVGGN
jgi:hypothetical protein